MYALASNSATWWLWAPSQGLGANAYFGIFLFTYGLLRHRERACFLSLVGDLALTSRGANHDFYALQGTRSLVRGYLAGTPSNRLGVRAPSPAGAWRHFLVGDLVVRVFGTGDGFT